MNKHAQTPSPPVSPPNDQLLHAGIFPHYTRLFSASVFPKLLGKTGKLILWVLLALSIATNFFILRPETIPHSFPWQTPAPDNGVLGTSDPTDVTRNNDTLTGKYLYWEKITQDYPDYRDAHIHAAMAAFQLGHVDVSRRHLDKVRTLDPNDRSLPQLENILGE